VFDHFQDKTVLIIGAGEMAELALTHMAGLKPGRVLVVNRSLPRGQQLAEQFGGQAWEFSKLNQALVEADLIVSTTASSEVIVNLETFARVQRSRRYRLALILDIAIPRDFDDRIGQLDQVMLYNVDDLKSQVQRNMAQRRGGLNAAHQLIETETAACMAALRHQRHAANVLKELGDHADRLREAELKSLFERLSGLSDKDRKEIERMAHRLQNQLLHEPRAALRSSAKSADEQQLSLPAAVGRLFGLGEGWSYRRKTVRTKSSEQEMESTEIQANAKFT
jgi:glutamyl-tRNA reductase